MKLKECLKPHFAVARNLIEACLARAYRSGSSRPKTSTFPSYNSTVERQVLTYKCTKSLYLTRIKIKSQMHILEALKLWKVRILYFRPTIVRQFNGINLDGLCYSESFWSRHNFSLSTKCISFAWIWEYADNRCTIAYYMHAQWGELFSKGVFLFFVIQICIYIFTRYL